MYENIVQAIICSQFDHAFGRGRSSDNPHLSDPDHAMQITFSLSPDYDKEDGYRHLTILIFGGGYNYISVYGKLDWTVRSNESNNDDYVKGETPWVLHAHHDSCWREGVGRLLWEFRDRVTSIDYLFNGQTGWYKSVLLSEENIAALNRILQGTPGYGNSTGLRVKLVDLDFQFSNEEVSK